MDVLVLIGRILFALLFLYSSLGHLGQTSMMAGYAASRGVPLARVATIVSGVVILLAGLSILLGIWADLGALLLVVFLVSTAVLIHGFWKDADAQARQNEMVHFFKDLALAGAALMLFAFFSFAGDEIGFTITGPLFTIG
jgi:putative oxidoreductase